MNGSNYYTGSNLVGTGGAFSNPFDIIQQGGKKRKTRTRKNKSLKNKTKGKKMKAKNKKSRKSVRSASLITMASRYFNIY